MKKYLSIILLLLIICFPLLSMAQDYGDGTEDAPIDGGLCLLIAAGIGYGAKKIKMNKIKNMHHA